MSIKIISDNKKARFDYQIIETYEAGLVLTGSEVKSIRAGQVSLKESFISFKGHEAFLQKAHIQVYQASSYNNHEPERLRKLLLHREELDKIRGRVVEKGLTAVPTKMYFKNGRIKLEIGLGRGKKTHDKRQSIKERDIKKQLRKY
ncbi:MAG: SsrA-binding protein SmpB [Bdellovibrionaceae bacterium]|nr:SsrA-binding protein SmpB [Pseudobdellovibrionaceae bacterium]